METSELLERIRDTLRQMPSGAGKMTLKGDEGGFEGWVGSWTLHGLLRDVARQLEDLQEANEDMAHELYLRRTGEPADIEARDDGLEERVESLESVFDELVIRCDNRHAALAIRLGEAERDIDTLRSQVGTLLEDLYARREAEREDEEADDYELPDGYLSQEDLTRIPGVDAKRALYILEAYPNLTARQLYDRANTNRLQREVEGVGDDTEKRIWQYLYSRYQELALG